jgi:hypothetical protein
MYVRTIIIIYCNLIFLKSNNWNFGMAIYTLNSHINAAIYSGVLNYHFICPYILVYVIITFPTMKKNWNQMG